MITPTIGRRVWYWPNAFDADQSINPQFLFHADPTQPLDAGIAYVHSDTMVNLSVADQIGINRSRVNVRLLQDDEVAEPGQAYAQWMPYQVAQAGIKPISDAGLAAIDKVISNTFGEAIAAGGVDQSPADVVTANVLADPVAEDAPVAADESAEVSEAAK